MSMQDPLAVLAAVYPDEDDEDYLLKISNKKEFVGPEYVPKFGDPRSYQRNMFRLLRANLSSFLSLMTLLMAAERACLLPLIW